ncbi:MAG: hypothetical protein BZ135_02270 [Methanosphaera sp. rholeuAM6]|nr:MAG: hypothetical protein BZ135_02270 [Methanosphaera sp. rholeuAM6]
MEQLVDLILTCDISELNKMEFPINQRFGLKVKSKGVEHEFVLNIKDNSDKLLVIGAGFIAKDKIETFRNRPVFSRISWKFTQSTLYYNDSTRKIDNVDLRGGWGIGTLDDWYLEDIAEIVKIIADKIYEYNANNRYKNLMFYGSSMGGFMSIILATLVKNSVAIAEIPQLELRDMRTNWPPLKEQLFNGFTDEEIEEYSYRLNVMDLIKREKYIPNAYLLLDCSSANDFNKQYKPFFDRLGELPYVENNNYNKIRIRIEGKNEGHHQMSQMNLLDAIGNVELIMDAEKGKSLPARNTEVNEEFNQLSSTQQEMLLKYITGRIDIVNYGENNSVELLESSDAKLGYKKIGWIDPSEGSGITTQSLAGNLDLTVMCKNKGKLTISLRSMYYKGTDNNIFPIYLDFTRFTVNNKTIVDNSEVVWHNKPYRYTKKVKDNEIVKLHIEWLPFNKESYFKK